MHHHSVRYLLFTPNLGTNAPTARAAALAEEASASDDYIKVHVPRTIGQIMLIRDWLVSNQWIAQRWIGATTGRRMVMIRALLLKRLDAIGQLLAATRHGVA